MKSAFTHWANLEAARDDSSMNFTTIRNLNKLSFYHASKITSIEKLCDDLEMGARWSTFNNKIERWPITKTLQSRLQHSSCLVLKQCATVYCESFLGGQSEARFDARFSVSIPCLLLKKNCLKKWPRQKFYLMTLKRRHVHPSETRKCNGKPTTKQGWLSSSLRLLDLQRCKFNFDKAINR